MEPTRVMKASTAVGPARPAGEPLIPAERLWAREQAEQILAEARRRTEQMAQAAAERASRLEKRLAESAARKLRRRTENMLNAVLSWQRRQKNQLRRAALETAVALAERLLRKQLEITPRDLRSLVESVLAESPLERPLTVLVHPRALAELQRAGYGRDIRFQAAEGLAPGDCLVRGDFGEVEGRMSVRLEVLKRSLERMEENVFPNEDLFAAE